MTFHKDLVGADLHGARAFYGTGSPVGVRTPGVIGEVYLDTATNYLWIAHGLTNADWTNASAILPHAATHQHLGSDEVATATPAANAILKAVGTGKINNGWIPDFVASGASHASGGVPDPGAVAGTTKFLREDATWASPASAQTGVVQSKTATISSNISTTSTTWPTASTTIAAGSNGATLPQATINVASTTGFPTAGYIYVFTSDAVLQKVAYTGVTGTSFTGCSGGTGTMNTGNLVHQAPYETTIAAGSNGVALPTGTINVASTTGFPASGNILVTTSNGPQYVTYTGTTGTSFTGCTGGTGTMSTGGAVVNVTTTVQMILSQVITTTGGDILARFLSCSSNSANNAVVYYRVLVDGAVYRGASQKANGGSAAGAAAVTVRITAPTAGAHIISVQWRVSSGTGQVRPVTNEDENASLTVEEIK